MRGRRPRAPPPGPERPRNGFEARIALKDLPSLNVWMPSLKGRPDPMPDDAPGWAFT